MGLNGSGWSVFDLEINAANGSVPVLSFAGADGCRFAKLDQCRTLPRTFQVTNVRVDMLQFKG